MRDLYEELAIRKGDMAIDQYSHYAPCRRLAEILALAGERIGGRILDIGCGDGILLKKIRDIGERDNLPLSLTGLDVSLIRLKRTRKRSGAEVVNADASHLPFADSVYDLVFCSQVMEHLPEPGKALAELGRVVKAGGVVIISLPVASWYTIMMSKLGRKVAFLDEVEHLREYSCVRMERFESIKEFVYALKEAGLRPATYRGVYYLEGGRLWDFMHKRGWRILSLVTLLDRLMGRLPHLEYLGRYLIVECRKAP